MKKRYRTFSSWIQETFGEKVYKVSLSSGCSCPNRDGTKETRGCSFCDWNSIVPLTGLGQPLLTPNQEIGSQLSEGMEYLKGRHQAQKFISYFQNGSNTHATLSHLERVFHEAITPPDVVGLAISTRPDCFKREHAKLLADIKKEKFVWLELGLQSASNKTLHQIHRGHTVEDFLEAHELAQEFGLDVCAHVILGLPNETTQEFTKTAKLLNRCQIWGVKIHNLHILKGTSLEKDYKEGLFQTPTLLEYAKWACDFLEELYPNIIIHRLSGHSPRRLTVAPDWSVNKLGTFNAIEKMMKENDVWQGKKFQQENHP